MTPPKKDTLYQSENKAVAPFAFNQEVASVFDDMLLRSIPFYRDIIHYQTRLVNRFYQPGTFIYDLGCSNGNLEIQLCQQATEDFKLVAVDNSEPMLSGFREKIKNYPQAHRIEVLCQDIMAVTFKPVSVIVLNFTLQFLPPPQRGDLLKRIYTALAPGGIFLLSEKIIHQDASFTRLQKDFYYDFKRENGYSELEISAKREALEAVLIPETIESHRQRLEVSGFQKIDFWYKWFNFTSVVCQK